MKPDEFKRIRKKFGFTQKEMALLLGFAGAQTVKNIEGGGINPGKLVMKLLRYLDSVPEKKATTFIEELNRHDPE